MIMAEYKVEVTTGNLVKAGTDDHVYVTLFGINGQSERTELDNFGRDFKTGGIGTYTISTSLSLGELLLLKVEKDPCFLLPEDEWYCSKIVVTTPEGDAILFPCYRWISRGEHVELRGGRAMKVFEDDHPLLVEHRREQLSLKKSFYRWKTLAEGLPHIIDFNDTSELPTEIRFSSKRSDEVQYTKITTGIELKLKGMLGSTEKFDSLEDMTKIFCFKSTTISEYVAEHWKEDDFFGYQFLNGINPNRIKRCSELPKNFPVTEEMVKPFLKEGSSLKEEIEEGHIFIYDQKKVDGMSGRDYNGEPLYVTPGLCLFYLNPQNKMMPIAIQLQQQPSEKNPIFLPSDSETDWLLAKMFIKNVDIMDHETVHHLMNTHFLAEVFTVATLRCFPEIHPLYKLLIPHFRYTLNINIGGRPALLAPGGPLSMSSVGYEGSLELMRRSLPEVTYSSLCLPENITAGGLESVPNFYYRDDGLRLWEIINRFVKGMVSHYYPADSDVQKDTELQEWISEIFTHGFLGNKASGFPTSFHTVEEVIKFITVVIFTVSAQHAAVNNGQFDYAVFIPNAPILLHKPPPTTKGQTSQETILEILPNVGETAAFAAMLVLLSEKYSDQVFLGTYPEQRFDEPATEDMIDKFQEELSLLSEAITTRNAKLEIPYTYLNPSIIENSISI
ncbi:hydroperoxide isomerase ALOXE3-like [Nelusetta ayraudi]|uniref:hydroperoxide isomerase ALOXE3-like n=1 Tax=Nelusetta ayraudi TaxID=303726 RepID=UPI003F6E6BE9